MDIFRLFAFEMGFGNNIKIPDKEMMLVFWNIRFPRIIMSFAAGCGLSIAGVVFQALFKNPLASPRILGVTFGASFGAALAIVFASEYVLLVQGSAFVFGTLAVALAYLLASRSWDRSAATLVISGIIISAVFQAGLNIMMYIANPYDQLAKIVFWTMGSFHSSSWYKLQTSLPLLAIGSLLIITFSWNLNIMTQDDEDALSLGVNIYAWRAFYVAVSTLMVASAVTSVGAINWIGLIIPHIARIIAGAEHKKLVPTAAILGGSFLMLMDTIARTLLASEIPISIVTSIFGAPFLAYLMIGRKYRNMGYGFTG